MEDLIGKRFKLSERLAKWHLDHPQIYFRHYNDDEFREYERETLMHLMVCFGVPMVGKVVCRGSMDDTWGVEFKIGKLKTMYFVETKDLEVI